MKKKRNWRCWIKVNQEKHITLHSNNLISLVRYLDMKYPDWRYFNVYGIKSNEQIANYTKSNRPPHKWPE